MGTKTSGNHTQSTKPNNGGGRNNGTRKRINRKLQRRKALSHGLGMLGIQRAVKVGASNDKHEQQANAVAKKVMEAPNPQPIARDVLPGGGEVRREELQHGGAKEIDQENAQIDTKPFEISRMSNEESRNSMTMPLQRMDDDYADIKPLARRNEVEGYAGDDDKTTIQAKCKTCDADDKGTMPPMAQRKAKGEGFNAGKQVSDNVAAIKSSAGRPLADADREFLEPRFGRDLSHVRIHNDDRAAETSHAIDAKAFTVGNDIAFNKGYYKPGASEGRSLLAHEITHTFQQTGGKKRGAGGKSGAKVGGVNRDVLQRESNDYSELVLEDYLRHLDATGKIENKNSSDNKALAVVSKWRRGYSKYILTAERKKLLIKELYTGIVWPGEQSAVLSLLKAATDRELHDIIASLGESFLLNRTGILYAPEMKSLLAKRRQAITRKADRGEGVFESKNVLELQKRFTANALKPSGSRAKCIQILYDLAPRLFNIEKSALKRGLGKVPVVGGKRGWIMSRFGPQLRRMGLSSEKFSVHFNLEKTPDPAAPNSPYQTVTGLGTPTPWDAIIDRVGAVRGWHIFGLAIHSGTHVQTVFVDNREDAPKLYLADQWNQPGDAGRHSGPGSAPGFRSYDKSRFNGHILYYTTRLNENWGNRKWDTTLYVWKFNPRH